MVNSVAEETCTGKCDICNPPNTSFFNNDHKAVGRIRMLHSADLVFGERCSHCSSFGSPIPYPCPTVQILAELNV